MIRKMSRNAKLPNSDPNAEDNWSYEQHVPDFPELGPESGGDDDTFQADQTKFRNLEKEAGSGLLKQGYNVPKFKQGYGPDAAPPVRGIDQMGSLPTGAANGINDAAPGALDGDFKEKGYVTLHKTWPAYGSKSE